MREAFNRRTLKRVCEMAERSFPRRYGMDVTHVDQSAPDDWYAFRDNGADILAVAHLDTVGLPHQRACRFIDTEAGTVVYSRALDDRLGAYMLLELLPSMGVTHDVLLTVGEESGQSTATFFDPPKDYRWIIEFDRGGTDVVLYQYEDDDMVQRVEQAGARVGEGSFSDVCYLEHLGVKALNWGVGYRDYHGPRAHAYLDDTLAMVGKYLRFHDDNHDVTLPHLPGTSEDEDLWSHWEDRCDWCWSSAGMLLRASGGDSPELCPECLDYWDAGARTYQQRYNLK